MNKKTRYTKSEKWRHTCNSVEIAWTNEQKGAVTSYGRNKNHDDEIKKHSRTSPEIQSKELNEKQTSHIWPADQLNTPSQRDKISTVENVTELNKRKKIIIIAKTLEATKKSTKHFLCLNNFWVLSSSPLSAGPKEVFGGPIKIVKLKNDEKSKYLTKSFPILWSLYLQNPFLASRGYPVSRKPLNNFNGA